MKCAVIISGQPRGVLETYTDIQNSLIKPNNADVFLHSWIDKEMEGKAYNANWLVNQGQSGIATKPIPKDIDKIILDVYQPKKYLFEPQKIFTYNPAIEKYKAKYLPIQDSFSMLYSLYSAIKLKQYYEIEHSIVYDVVIRIRFGMRFLYPQIIDLSNYICYGNLIFVPSGFNGFDHSAFLNNTSFCDHWTIGNSHMINRLSETFLNIEDLVLNHHCFIQNEDLLGYWMRRKNNINIALLDLKYQINCQ